MLKIKTIGLVGGMSWESTLLYYKIINEDVRKRLGGLNSAKILLNSINFIDLEPHQREGRWSDAASVILDASQKLEVAGAEVILICSNTGNEAADYVQSMLNIPVIHIADVTAKKIIDKGLKKVALLGTRYTMEKDYIKKRMETKYGLKVLTPNLKDRILVNSIIYDELCMGIIKKESKEEYLRIIDSLIKKGAQAVILGCTEIPILISQNDLNIPVFDTTELHAISAVDFSLSEQKIELENIGIKVEE